MAMQKLGGKNFEQEERISFEEAGTTVEGYYLGSKSYEYEGEPRTKHLFRGVDKVLYSCGGTTVLNQDLEGIEVGTMVRVTYEGKAKSKAGRSFKKFSIEFDSEDKIAV